MALVSPMVRTALIVSDLQRSTHFYSSVLEMDEVYAEGGLSHATAAKLLGMPTGTRLRYRIFRVDGLNKGMVGLFELSDPAPPRVQKRIEGCSVGETCLVFYCADLDVIHQRLLAGNHMVVCPPMHLDVEIEDGAIQAQDRGQREMTFRDPDGVLINLIERDPTSND